MGFRAECDREQFRKEMYNFPQESANTRNRLLNTLIEKQKKTNKLLSEIKELLKKNK